MNIICEFDCGLYDWRCIYKWKNVLNGRIYINENNLCIDRFLKENVIFVCFVVFEYNNNIYSYSKRIKIFIKGNFVYEFFGINLILILYFFKNINCRKF